MTDYIPKYENFEDSFIAFIDILGFSNRVMAIKNENDFREISKLVAGKELIADVLDTNKDILNGFKTTSVSDSLIISVPCTISGSAASMLLLLHQIQYIFLLNFKTLLRGYISEGSVYHKNNILFGPGYINAYNGERTIGSAPRIVLNPMIVKNAMRDINQYGKERFFGTVLDYIKEDANDGFYFIDFLKPLNIQSALPKEQLAQNLQIIYSFITQNLEKYCNDYIIYPKYKWLENYYKGCELYFTQINN
jgi:hypothetical protein